jgi:50S ribosomal subunit-associated GTPase HflX
MDDMTIEEARSLVITTRDLIALQVRNLEKKLGRAVRIDQTIFETMDGQERTANLRLRVEL